MDYSLIVFKIGFVILVGFIANLLVGKSLNGLAQHDLLPAALTPILKGVCRWLIILFVLLVCLQQVGIPLSTIFASLSALAALIALGFVAVWSILSNITSALLLILLKPFRIGDVIEVRDPGKEPGISGRVTGLNLLFTSLTAESETGTTDQIRIPNNLLFQKVLICKQGMDTISLREGFKGTETAPASGQQDSPGSDSR